MDHTALLAVALAGPVGRAIQGCHRRVQLASVMMKFVRPTAKIRVFDVVLDAHFTICAK